MNDKPVSMTSVDSGVETGNDSNDSMIVQHESQQQQYGVTSNQSTDNNIAIVATGNSNEIGCSNEQEQSALNMFRMQIDMPLDVPSLLYTPYVPCYATKKREDVQTLLSRYRILKMVTPKTISEKRNTAKWYERNIYSICGNKIARLKRYTNITCEAVDYVIQVCGRKLRFAAATNNTILLKRLLAEGVSPNIPDGYGRTPLHHASSRGYTDIVRLLLTYGADPNYQDCMGNIPLHLATANHRVAIVTLLLSGGSIIPFDEVQFGLKILGWKLDNLKAPLQVEDVIRMRQELSDVMDILRASADTKENTRDQMEILNNVCSRLSLSSSDQVQDDIKDLLTNLNDLRITNHTDSIPPP